MGILTKSPLIADDIEQSKTMIIYYPLMFNMCLRHNQINYGELWENTSMNLGEHDLMLCAMVKTTLIGDLNSKGNLVSKISVCHKHQKKFVKCHKMRLPDL